MKYILFLITAFTLVSCNDSRKELVIQNENLLLENQSLKKRLQEIEAAIDQFHQEVVFIPKQQQIILGDKYEAAVFQVLRQKGIPTSLTLYDNSSNPKFTDTLKFKQTDPYPRISFIPEDTGLYKIEGQLKQTILGIDYDLWFQSEFEVKSK